MRRRGSIHLVLRTEGASSPEAASPTPLSPSRLAPPPSPPSVGPEPPDASAPPAPADTWAALLGDAALCLRRWCLWRGVRARYELERMHAPTPHARTATHALPKGAVVAFLMHLERARGVAWGGPAGAESSVEGRARRTAQEGDFASGEVLRAWRVEALACWAMGAIGQLRAEADQLSREGEREGDSATALHDHVRLGQVIALVVIGRVQPSPPRLVLYPLGPAAADSPSSSRRDPITSIAKAVARLGGPARVRVTCAEDEPGGATAEGEGSSDATAAERRLFEFIAEFSTPRSLLATDAVRIVGRCFVRLDPLEAGRVPYRCFEACKDRDEAEQFQRYFFAVSLTRGIITRKQFVQFYALRHAITIANEGKGAVHQLMAAVEAAWAQCVPAHICTSPDSEFPPDSDTTQQAKGSVARAGEGSPSDHAPERGGAGKEEEEEEVKGHWVGLAVAHAATGSPARDVSRGSRSTDQDQTAEVSVSGQAAPRSAGGGGRSPSQSVATLDSSPRLSGPPRDGVPRTHEWHDSAPSVEYVSEDSASVGTGTGDGANSDAAPDRRGGVGYRGGPRDPGDERDRVIARHPAVLSKQSSDLRRVQSEPAAAMRMALPIRVIDHTEATDTVGGAGPTVTAGQEAARAGGGGGGGGRGGKEGSVARPRTRTVGGAGDLNPLDSVAGSVGDRKGMVDAWVTEEEESGEESDEGPPPPLRGVRQRTLQRARTVRVASGRQWMQSPPHRRPSAAPAGAGLQALLAAASAGAGGRYGGGGAVRDRAVSPRFGRHRLLRDHRIPSASSEGDSIADTSPRPPPSESSITPSQRGRRTRREAADREMREQAQMRVEELRSLAAWREDEAKKWRDAGGPHQVQRMHDAVRDATARAANAAPAGGSGSGGGKRSPRRRSRAPSPSPPHAAVGDGRKGVTRSQSKSSVSGGEEGPTKVPHTGGRGGDKEQQRPPRRGKGSGGRGGGIKKPGQRLKRTPADVTAAKEDEDRPSKRAGSGVFGTAQAKGLRTLGSSAALALGVKREKSDNGSGGPEGISDRAARMAELGTTGSDRDVTKRTARYRAGDCVGEISDGCQDEEDEGEEQGVENWTDEAADEADGAALLAAAAGTDHGDSDEDFESDDRGGPSQPSQPAQHASVGADGAVDEASRYVPPTTAPYSTLQQHVMDYRQEGITVAATDSADEAALAAGATDRSATDRAGARALRRRQLQCSPWDSSMSEFAHTRQLTALPWSEGVFVTDRAPHGGGHTLFRPLDWPELDKEDKERDDSGRGDHNQHPRRVPSGLHALFLQRCAILRALMVLSGVSLRGRRVPPPGSSEAMQSMDLDNFSLSEISDTESDTESEVGDAEDDGDAESDTAPRSVAAERSLESHVLWRGAHPLEWAVGDPGATAPQTRLRAQACLTGSVVDADTSSIVQHAASEEPTRKQQQQRKKRRHGRGTGSLHDPMQGDGIPATATVPARVLRAQLNGSLDLELETGQVARSVPSDRVRVRALRPPRGGADSRPLAKGLDAEDATRALRRARARTREARAAFRAVRDGRVPLRHRVHLAPRTLSPTGSATRTPSRRRTHAGRAPSAPLLAPGARSGVRADATNVRTVVIGGGRGRGDGLSKSAGPCDLAQFILQAVFEELQAQPTPEPSATDSELDSDSSSDSDHHRGSWTDHDVTDPALRRPEPHAVFVGDAGEYAEVGEGDSLTRSQLSRHRSRTATGSGLALGWGSRADAAGLTSPKRARGASCHTDTSPHHDPVASVDMDASSGWDDPLEGLSEGSSSPTEHSAPRRAERVRGKLLSRLRARLDSVNAFLDSPPSPRNGHSKQRRRQRRRRRRAEKECGQLQAAIRRLEGAHGGWGEGDDESALSAIGAGLLPGDEGDLAGDLAQGQGQQRSRGISMRPGGGAQAGDEWTGEGASSPIPQPAESQGGDQRGTGPTTKDVSAAASDDPGATDPLFVETDPSLAGDGSRSPAASPWPLHHPSSADHSAPHSAHRRGDSVPHSGSSVDTDLPSSRREAARRVLEAWGEQDAAWEHRRTQRIEVWVRRGGDVASLDAALEAWWAYARRGSRRGLDQSTFFSLEGHLYEALIGERSRDANVRARASARADWRQHCSDGLRMRREEYCPAMLVLAHTWTPTGDADEITTFLRRLLRRCKGEAAPKKSCDRNEAQRTPASSTTRLPPPPPRQDATAMAPVQEGSSRSHTATGGARRRTPRGRDRSQARPPLSNSARRPRSTRGRGSKRAGGGRDRGGDRKGVRVRAEVEDAAAEILRSRQGGGPRETESDRIPSPILPEPLFSGDGLRVIDHSTPGAEEAKQSLIATGERATPPPPPELDSLMGPRDHASLRGSTPGRGGRRVPHSALSVRERVEEEFRASRGTWDAYDTHAVRPGRVVRELSEGRLRATYGVEIDAECDRRLALARHAQRSSDLALRGVTRRAVLAHQAAARDAKRTLAQRRVQVFALAGVPRSELSRSEDVDEGAARLLRQARRGGAGLPSIT